MIARRVSVSERVAEHAVTKLVAHTIANRHRNPNLARFMVHSLCFTCPTLISYGIPLAGARSDMKRAPIALVVVALLAGCAHGLSAETPDTLPQPGDEFDDCGGENWCPRMVIIPAGGYTMGSPDSEPHRASNEGPQRRVDILEFAVGKFEVTFEQWAQCANDGGCHGYQPPDEDWGRGDRPVISVSWEEAQDYVHWLSNRTAHPYRLLTEAEWEYAARARTSSPYPWGDSPSRDFANYGADSCCLGFASGRDQWGRATAPVGSFPPNAFGLHDMHGNVLEWVQDCYSPSYQSLPTDGSAHEVDNCRMRIYRGGSWFYDPVKLRSANRLADTPENRHGSVGFRVARTL
jgi:formylglycine-generating enzyme required for sulfatase activity